MTRPRDAAAEVVVAELRAVSIGNVRPIRWEGGTETDARFMVLTLEDRSGRRGVAECTVKPTWNGFDVETFSLAFERLVLPYLWRARADGTPLTEQLGRLVDNAAPKALLESALWDLAIASGPREDRDPVPVSATITRGAPADMAAEAAVLVERYGFGTLKLKGGQGTASDVEAVRLVRAAVGDDLRLYVDANGAVPAAAAEDYVRRLADLGIAAIEDPCNLVPDHRLRRIQAAAGIPVIADFKVDGVSSARAFLELGCGGLSIKPNRFGVRKALAMGAVAGDADALAVVGMFGESQAGAAHLLAVHAALAGQTRLLPAEATAALLLVDHYLREPLTVRDGHIAPPLAANLAALIDPDRLDRLTATTPRRWTRPL